MAEQILKDMMERSSEKAVAFTQVPLEGTVL